MTKIYLIRHGEAEGNVFRRIHGQYDSLLTPTGFAQAECVKKRFESIPVDACFSSDLTRTSLTSRSIYVPKGLKLRRSPSFREVGLGRWEDIPFGTLERFESEKMRCFNNDPPAWQVEGSETFDGYTTRFIEGMVRAAEEFPGGTVAIFCHGAVLRGVLERLFFWGRLEELPYCDNTAVSCLHYDHGQCSYEYLNDNSHLPSTLSTFAKQRWWRQLGLNKQDFNLWYQPLREVPGLAAGLAAPEAIAKALEVGEPEDAVLGMLGDTPAGLICLDPVKGAIEALALREDLKGLYMEDQFLGHAVSRLRKLGFSRVLAKEEAVSGDRLLERYGFQDNSMNICTGIYTWD